MVQAFRGRLGEIVLIALVLWVTGAQVQCPGSVEARESLVTLRADIDAVAAEVDAITPQRIELVGFTTSTFTGGEGVLGFTLACQTDFPGSRMCTSVEVMRTTNVPASLSGNAWVRPSFEGFVWLGSPGIPVASDSSGTEPGETEYLTCSGWIASDAYSGLVVTANGGFDILACDQARAVACCAPAP
jgi:hypothetical protein